MFVICFVAGIDQFSMILLVLTIVKCDWFYCNKKKLTAICFMRKWIDFQMNLNSTYGDILCNYATHAFLNFETLFRRLIKFLFWWGEDIFIQIYSSILFFILFLILYFNHTHTHVYIYIYIYIYMTIEIYTPLPTLSFLAKK